MPGIAQTADRALRWLLACIVPVVAGLASPALAAGAASAEVHVEATTAGAVAAAAAASDGWAPPAAVDAETIAGIIVNPRPRTPVAPGLVPLGNPLAASFPAGLGGNRERALDCLTMAIAYEAGNEPVAGQQAVGQVILNRVRTGRFQKSVCGVVFAGSERVTGCQFTFTCDGSLNRRLRDTTWTNARNAAATVLAGTAPDRVGGATHYHADYVLPYWAGSGTRTNKIGAHIFYRMPGDQPTRVAPVVADESEPDFIPYRSQRSRRRGGALAMAAPPVAVRPVFAPWGLPLGGTAGN